MRMAYLCGKRSKDNCTQVGACIVNKLGNIIAMGYNGFPYGCSDEIFPWTKTELVDEQVEKNKHLYVCHAELNAMSKAGLENLKDCVMYVTMHPCNECAKRILKCGIEKVVYLSDKNKNQEGVKASVEMLGEKLEQFKIRGPGKYEIHKSDDLNVVDGSRILQFENPEKRKNYLSLKDFFMAVAVLASSESTPIDVTKTGACIVRPPFHVVAIGHKEEMETLNAKTQNRSLYVCHSPVAAIANRNCGSIADCEIYTTHFPFPCNECVKAIIQSKIKKIYYMTELSEMDAAEELPYRSAYKMLKASHVSFELYNIK